MTFEQVFCARVRAARQAARMMQADMARVLGVNLATYARYETRTLLPHHLVEEFAKATGVEIAELFDVETGRL